MFTFQTLWTPRVILVIYIIGLVLIVISGLAGAYFAMQGVGGPGAFGQPAPSGGLGLIWAVVLTLISIVLWRVWCEIVLVLFKLHDRLVEVRDAIKH